jgi:hypothetical protein
VRQLKASAGESSAPLRADGGANEREQRIVYLRQAFTGFFRAKKEVEMQHLGRVICAILELAADEQALVMEGISKLTPALITNSTIESFTSNLTSAFFG